LAVLYCEPDGALKKLFRRRVNPQAWRYIQAGNLVGLAPPLIRKTKLPVTPLQGTVVRVAPSIRKTHQLLQQPFFGEFEGIN
jgi:hypothetical protein